MSMMTDDVPADALPIAAALLGDVAAFHTVVVGCVPMVRLHLGVRGCRGFLLDELIQDTFIKAWEQRAQCRSSDSFIPWLKAIARNGLAREMRQRLRHAETHRDIFDMALCQRVLAETADDVDQAQFDQRSRALRACVDALAPQARALVDARYVHAEPVDALATRLGRTTSWVKVTLHRIRATLRTCLDRGTHVAP